MGNLLILVHQDTMMLSLSKQPGALNEAQEQFAYRAAHDLHSPLASIYSFGKLLQRRYLNQLNTEGHEFLTIMLEASDRARKLTKDLLQYLVLPAPIDLEPIKLEKVFQQVRTNLSAQLQSSEAVIHCDALPEVRGNDAQLITLFEHLIKNAITFKGEHPPHIAIRVTSLPDVWSLTLQDWGSGIEARHLSGLFDGFQRHRAREKNDGTGLGLALCRKIMVFHGGTIQVSSSPGEGTCFDIRFPKG